MALGAIHYSCWGRGEGCSFLMFQFPLEVPLLQLKTSRYDWVGRERVPCINPSNWVHGQKYSTLCHIQKQDPIRVFPSFCQVFFPCFVRYKDLPRDRLERDSKLRERTEANAFALQWIKNNWRLLLLLIMAYSSEELPCINVFTQAPPALSPGLEPESRDKEFFPRRY